MSTKRISSDNDEPPNEGSNSALLQGDNAKRAKLTTTSDTTLQDLPPELLERLLVKAVVMCVKSMKLVKSVWKEKADLVISRLRTVCSQWNRILTSDYLRSEVHEILDNTAQKTIRLKIIQQSPIQLEITQVTTMNDELFVLREKRGEVSILVFDRSDTTYEKDTIVQPGIHPLEIAGCSASNCVYVLCKGSQYPSVQRITKQENHQFNISPWISDMRLPMASISVSPISNLVILSRGLFKTQDISKQVRPNPAHVKVYDPTGSLQHEIMLTADIISVRYVFDAIEKFNGNILLASLDQSHVLLTEIDTTGRMLRQYETAIYMYASFDVSFIDIHGRILLNDKQNTMALLDSELNPLDFTIDKQLGVQYVNNHKYQLHYDIERNEIVSVCEFSSPKTRVLTVFRYIEE